LQALQEQANRDRAELQRLLAQPARADRGEEAALRNQIRILEEQREGLNHYWLNRWQAAHGEVPEELNAGTAHFFRRDY